MRLIIFLSTLMIFKSSCDTASVESDAISLVKCDDSKRAIVEKLVNIEATVTFLNNEGSIIVIVPKANQTQRYVACNLPKELTLKDGISVVFSADVKEIMPNERWPGTPVELNAVKLKSTP